MSVLWKYLKPQKWLIVVALVLVGISQLLNLIDPLIFKKGCIRSQKFRKNSLAPYLLPEKSKILRN